MSQKELNLGILAHVDAGKTTLTERLLFEAGAIDAIGSVDAGTTLTDSLALEQQRGITIRSAVASFALNDDVHVNLIDTPGHPDFIAEVERVLNVLDGAVLVVSAVEGVQPQTRILMRALDRLQIPTVAFVNKTDRTGADEERVLREIGERLPPVAGVFCGSARTGAGVAELRGGIAELLPTAAGEPGGPLSAVVFKIERASNGEKIAYVRAFSGTIRVRDRVQFGREGEGKVTALAVFERGPATKRQSVAAGQVAKLWGLREIQVGDRIGDGGGDRAVHEFAPPTLEAVIAARDRGEQARLRGALLQLAEQDPLIGVGQDDYAALSVSLYGDVQKEVIGSTLASDYGLDVKFEETIPICIERPVSTAEGVEILKAESNPYLATIGLRIDPAAVDSGVEFRVAVDHSTIPLYLYKTHESFAEHMAGYVRDALEHGLRGWQVTDCVVTLTRCLYSVPDGPPSRSGPLSTAADFRKLTPIVIAQALARARTVVCEPVMRVRLEVPTAALGAVVAAVGRLGVGVETPSVQHDLAVVQTVVPTHGVHELQQQLPGLTGGEGVLESAFAGYRPVSGEQPARRGR